jgi:hypothetical protein
MKNVEVDAGNNKKLKVNLDTTEFPEYDELCLMACHTISELKNPIEFDQHTIHKVFANRTDYVACIANIPARNEETGKIGRGRIIIVKDNLEELTKLTKAVFDLNEHLSTIYYYLPDFKYIFLIREGEFCCIDYGNFNYESPGETLVVHITGADKPLSTRKYLSDADHILSQVKDCQELFKTGSNIWNADKHICNYCKINKEKLLICSRCRATRYCDQTCQQNDWLEHKKTCEKVQVVNASKNKVVNAKLQPAKVNQ